MAHPSKPLNDFSQFIHFLNSLPRVNDLDSWIEQTKAVLMELIDGVDRISLFFNVSAYLTTAEQQWITFFAEDGPLHTNYDDAILSAMPSIPSTPHLTIMPETVTMYPRGSMMSSIASIIYDDLKRTDPRVLQYQDPIVFDYYSSNQKFLGGIFLWREQSKMPVPQSTIELVDQLHDFIMFLLEDGLMRYDFQQPMFRGFVSAVARLDKSTQLEDHESRVLGHLLLGKTYDQIADTMKLSVNTVRKYITSIYKKAGVHSLNELYAKYFMPWSW